MVGAITLIFSGAVFGEPTAAVSIVRTNILVILMDDMGYNDVGFMGSKDILTPNIDQLATSGMVFTDAHLAGNTCSPSRASIQTARYQQRFGHYNNLPPKDKGMDPAETTMGQAFQKPGYKTYYIGKWHLGDSDPYHPNQRGYDEFIGLLEGHRSYFRDEKEDKPGSARAIEHNAVPYDWEGYVTDVFTQCALDFLDEERDNPFFIFLSYTAHHAPMHAKEEHFEKFAGHPRQKLAAMMWSAGEGIGCVLGKLDELNIRDNTLVFFISDNSGTMANNNENGPLKGFKGSKFEGGQHTPFIISWRDRIPAGSSFDGLISSMDIYPTAAAATGVDCTIGKPIDGVNLLPYIDGQVKGDPHRILFWQRSNEYAVRTGDYKLVGHKTHGWRLYNLEEDLGETNNVAQEKLELASRMLEEFNVWKEQLVESWWQTMKDWEQVKDETYRALLNNELPRYTTPNQMKKYQNRDQQ